MTHLILQNAVFSIVTFCLLALMAFFLIELIFWRKPKPPAAAMDGEILNDEDVIPVTTKAVVPTPTETDALLNAQIAGYFELSRNPKPTLLDKLSAECAFFTKRARRNVRVARTFFLILASSTMAVYIGKERLFFDVKALLFALGVVILATYVLPLLILKYRARMVKKAVAASFPDFLDILVICLETGMTAETALGQIGKLMAKTEPLFGVQLLVAVYEIRAGRTAFDALSNMADRTELSPAKDLASLIQESVTLGLSVGRAVRVYAREMRQTEILNAEERANTLPVKMVIPLTVFMLPANMIVILSPSIINLMTTLEAFFGTVQ